MSEFNFKKYLKEGKLLKEEKSASDFKYGDRIIYNFNGKQIPGKILDHFGDGIFIGLDKSISFKDPESVGRANPMGYNTDLDVKMFELFDGEENPYGSINNVELAESQTLKENITYKGIPIKKGDKFRDDEGDIFTVTKSTFDKIELKDEDGISTTFPDDFDDNNFEVWFNK